MVHLGRPATHDRATESGLSAIAEQTERSRTDSAHHADAHSPVNSLYNRVYPLSYDPNHSVRPSYDLSSLPSSSQAGDHRASTARSPPGRSSWNAFVDPDMPATPPLTVFSETTLGPDDSASQVGWRRAQAEAQANYFAIGRQMEEQRVAESTVDGQDRTPETELAVPLHVANKTPQSSSGLVPPTAAPSPGPASPTPPPQRDSPSPTRPQKRTRFLGIPLIRILSGRSRNRPSPSSSTGAAVDLEQPPPPPDPIPEEPRPDPATSPTGSLRRPLPPIPHPPSPSTSATELRPPPPIYGSPSDQAFAPSSAASAPSKGVFSRLDHAFGQHPSTHSRNPTGSSRGLEVWGRQEDETTVDDGERSSTELTGPTGPMQGFLRPSAGGQGPVGVRRDHEGWRGAF